MTPIEQAALQALLADCGEAGCAEGRCGNLDCLPRKGHTATLAQPVQPKKDPVAWINCNVLTGKLILGRECESELASEPLYTSPPQRKPLTEEQIEVISKNIERSDFFDCVVPFARAIEAAHGIGEKVYGVSAFQANTVTTE